LACRAAARQRLIAEGEQGGRTDIVPPPALPTVNFGAPDVLPAAAGAAWALAQPAVDANQVIAVTADQLGWGGAFFKTDRALSA
jgi:hypothetical protein